MRSKSTINRLRMYKNFKPTRFLCIFSVCIRTYCFRDAKGKVTRAAPFQGTLKSGTVARVEPHRRWFGRLLIFLENKAFLFR
jgi:nuclear GTP-binding protein